MSLLLREPTEAFAPYRSALIALGEARPDVVVLGADLGTSTEIDGFQTRFPDRFFNFGAAEQNEVAAAAGMAFEGLVPFVHSFGVFLTRRAYEQVCVQVAMHRANVKLVGVIPGLTSRLGPTHQAIEDLALMRTLPGMTVIDPADATEIEQAVPAIAAHMGPVYLRMLRREVPRLLDPAVYRFEIGRAVTIRDGSDVAILSCGVMLGPAVEAAGLLSDAGISAAVVHVPTIRPLDRDAVAGWASRTRAVVTAENHLVAGGLGAAVAEVVSETRPVPMRRVGLRDTFAVPGSPGYLFERYGLNAEAIRGAASEALGARLDGAPA
jgi:transketolase